MTLNGAANTELLDDFQVRVVKSSHDQDGLDHHDKHSRKIDQFADKFDGRIIAALLSWYFWSALTLFLNKYIIDRRDGDSALLSTSFDFSHNSKTSSKVSFSK